MRRTILSLTLTGLLAVGCSSSESNSENKQTEATTEMTAEHTNTDFMNIPLATISGDSTSLAAYEGNVLLLVNTASKCGYTSQYSGLEELYREYKDSGLVIIGFPANNFGGQEPGSNEQIARFCSENFDVTFPMMAKISVKGDDKHPLYTYLTEQSPFTGDISWNFNKFVVNRDGEVIARFDSGTKPKSEELVGAITRAL